MRNIYKTVSAGICSLLISIAQSCFASTTVLDNQMNVPLVIKLKGPTAREYSLKAKDALSIEIKHGIYYSKIQMDYPDGKKYAVGPYIEVPKAYGIKTTISIDISPSAGTKFITKEQFHDMTQDASLLRRAYSVPNTSLRWARVILDAITTEQSQGAQQIFSLMAQLRGESISGKDYQGLNVKEFSGATNTLITEVIKRHGEPTTRGSATHKQKSGDKEIDVQYDTFNFDGITVECRKGKNTIEWLYAPFAWFVTGIRAHAECALNPGLPTIVQTLPDFTGGTIKTSYYDDLISWNDPILKGPNAVEIMNPSPSEVSILLRSDGRGENLELAAQEKKSVSLAAGQYDLIYYFSKEVDKSKIIYLKRFDLPGTCKRVETMREPGSGTGIFKLKQN